MTDKEFKLRYNEIKYCLSELEKLFNELPFGVFRKKIAHRIYAIKNREKLNNQSKLYYHKNIEKRRSYSRQYAKQHREKMNEYSQNYRKKFPARDFINMRNSHLKRKYKMTMQEYLKRKELQDWKCNLCHQPLKNTTRDDVVDHCHKTQKIRGILHLQCNALLGQCRDSIEILELAVDYLKRNRW